MKGVFKFGIVFCFFLFFAYAGMSSVQLGDGVVGFGVVIGNDSSNSSNTTFAGKYGGGPYLYNDSTTIYLNESKLNATIDARSGGGGGGNVSDVWLNESGDTLRGELNFTNEALLTDNSTQIFFEGGDVVVWFR